MSSEMGTRSPKVKNWQSQSWTNSEINATTQSEVHGPNTALAGAETLADDFIVDT